MQNTLNKAVFRMMIYKNRADNSYVGICFETGLVENWATLEETKKHLRDGTVAILKSIDKGDLSIEAINQKPSIHYRFLFILLPLLWGISKLFSVTLITEPFSPLCFRNAG